MQSPPAWSIRAAGRDDADVLSLVAGAVFLETYAGDVDGQGIVAHCADHLSAQAFAAHFADGARIWLAEVEPGGAPVGYALACRPDLAAARDGDWELRRIYVLSRFHGSGIARALMAEVLAAAGGHERLLLGVKADNHRALAFYGKQGFRKIGTRAYRVGDKSYDDFVLARPLAPATTDIS